MLFPSKVISAGSLAELSLVTLASCVTSAGGSAIDGELLPTTATLTDPAKSASAKPVAVDRRFHHEDTKREGVEIEEVEIERANMPLTPARSSSSYMSYITNDDFTIDMSAYAIGAYKMSICYLKQTKEKAPREAGPKQNNWR